MTVAASSHVAVTRPGTQRREVLDGLGEALAHPGARLEIDERTRG
jgi:hypothetical protein